MTRVIDDIRVGAVIRAVRIRRGWRQSDVATRARVDRSTISRVERGHLGSLSVDTVRRVAAALDIRLDLVPRWRGGDLDRLLGASHSALHEAFAIFISALPDWISAPEVSFSIYGERGVIDVLLWHAASRCLLIVELKTEVVDVQDLLGSMDRRLRLAGQIARDRDWRPLSISAWVVVAEGSTNRRRVAAHRTVLRNAFPANGVQIRAWLRDPRGSIRALSLWSDGHGQHARRRAASPRCVSEPRGRRA